MPHIYVMQNEFGLIKIGRSGRPETRRKTLEKADICDIAIVTVVELAGHREEEIHAALYDHRLIGEWFGGDDEARAAIIRVVGLCPETVWPYQLANKDADAWLERVEQHRWATRVDKEFQRQIHDVQRMPDRSATDDSRWDDGHIWTLIWGFEHELPAGVDVSSGKKGELILQGYCEGKDPQPLPLYTTELEAALSIWPDEDRPEDWTGTPWECCIAALRARKAKIALRRKAVGRGKG
jgi:hypothetical protein